MKKTSPEIDPKKYYEQLKHMSGPILPSELPKIKMNLKGLSNYAKAKEVSVEAILRR